MNMKIKYILIIVAAMISLTLHAYAHPGKTDKYGGHYDNETGEYHYHHGYPAHEHIDGVCPYDFDDNTGKDSRPSTGSTATKKPENHIEAPDPLSPAMADSRTTPPHATTKQTSITSKTEKEENGIVGYIIGGGILLFFALGLIGHIIERIELYSPISKPKKEKNNKKSLPPASMTVPQKTLTAIPEGYTIGDDGLPYKNNREYGWGKEFNVFVTKYGKCYHRSKCNSLTPTNKRLIHRYTAINDGYKPCPRCKPKNYIDDWYKQ